MEIETLHAYAAGEVPEAASTAIKAHVESCSTCAEGLGRVRAMRALMGQMAPAPIDDLSWARLGRRIQAELRTPPSVRPQLELGRWIAPFVVIAGTALATAVVVMAWPGTPSETRVVPMNELVVGPPRPALLPVDPEVAPSEASEPSPSPLYDLDLEGSRLVASGEAFDVDLRGGLKLRLAPRSEVRVLSSTPEKVVLQVMRGKLDVAQVDVQGPHVELRAPGLKATARGARFTVALVANAPAVLQVQAGDVHVARADAPRAATSPIPSSAAVVAASPSPAVPEQPWMAAQRAWHEGRYESALKTARAIVDAGTGGAETQRSALGMVCDAEVALDHVESAILACEAHLTHVDGHEARLIRFRLAQIYRTRMNNCARAIQYYDRMVVVGSAAAIDRDALLGRAECALSLGDLDVAARDLGFLSKQSSARLDAYGVLVERLRAARARAQESSR